MRRARSRIVLLHARENMRRACQHHIVKVDLAMPYITRIHTSSCILTFSSFFSAFFVAAATAACCCRRASFAAIFLVFFDACVDVAASDDAVDDVPFSSDGGVSLPVADVAGEALPAAALAAYITHSTSVSAVHDIMTTSIRWPLFAMLLACLLACSPVPPPSPLVPSPQP